MYLQNDVIEQSSKVELLGYGIWYYKKGKAANNGVIPPVKIKDSFEYLRKSCYIACLVKQYK